MLPLLGAWVQSLARGLRSFMPYSTTRKDKKTAAPPPPHYPSCPADTKRRLCDHSVRWQGSPLQAKRRGSHLASSLFLDVQPPKWNLSPSLWLRRERTYLPCRRPRFDPWIGKIPWRRKWQPTLEFLPGKSHEQRSLVGCSP